MLLVAIGITEINYHNIFFSVSFVDRNREKKLHKAEINTFPAKRRKEEPIFIYI